MLNLFFFKTFVDAAKIGSFRSAAAKNHITQPAVTQHIRLIEQKLGCKLFERHSKKISLTPCGKAFLIYAERILKQYEEAKMHLSEIDKQFLGTIRIATIYSIGLYNLKPIIKRYLEQFPKVDIHLEYHPFNKIYEMIGERTIDFGFVAYPQKKRGITFETFVEEDLVLVQSAQRPILRKKEVHFSDLNKIRFVAFNFHTPTRRAIDQFLHSKDVHPQVVNEYDNIQTLKSAIELGIGCSILPQNTLKHDIKNRTLEIIPLRGFSLKRPLAILYPAGKNFTALTQEFLDITLNKKTAELPDGDPSI